LISVAVMTMTERKVIEAKVGLLELAQGLGSVTQAFRGTAGAASAVSAICMRRAAIWREPPTD
jgi:hypothetical protein